MQRREDKPASSASANEDRDAERAIADMPDAEDRHDELG